MTRMRGLACGGWRRARRRGRSATRWSTIRDRRRSSVSDVARASRRASAADSRRPTSTGWRLISRRTWPRCDAGVERRRSAARRAVTSTPRMPSGRSQAVATCRRSRSRTVEAERPSGSPARAGARRPASARRRAGSRARALGQLHRARLLAAVAHDVAARRACPGARAAISRISSSSLATALPSTRDDDVVGAQAGALGRRVRR